MAGIAQQAHGRLPVRTGGADWARVIVATLARAIACTVLGLILWAAAPALIGWQPTTVMTGSMEPRLHPGDIVVAKPVPTTELRPGQVLLFDDPDRAHELRLHRYVALGTAGELITKGDANPANDSTPVPAHTVHGVGFIRVPFIGAPVLWARDGDWLQLGMLGLVGAVIAWLTTLDRRIREADGGGASGSGGPPGPGSRSDGLEGLRSSGTQARHRGTRVGTGAWGRTVVVLVTAIVGGVAMPAAASAAAFGTTTANPTSTLQAYALVAPTAVGCAPVQGSSTSVTISWAYTGPDPATSFDILGGTAGSQPTVWKTVAGPNARSTTLSAPSLVDLGTKYIITVRANATVAGTTTWTSSATSTSATAVTTSAVVLTSISCSTP